VLRTELTTATGFGQAKHPETGDWHAGSAQFQNLWKTKLLLLLHHTTNRNQDMDCLSKEKTIPQNEPKSRPGNQSQNLLTIETREPATQQTRTDHQSRF
jgi:hypothetical protein